MNLFFWRKDDDNSNDDQPKPGIIERLIYGKHIEHFPVSKADPAPLPDAALEEETNALLNLRDEELSKLRHTTHQIRSQSLKSLTTGVLLEFTRR